MARPNRSREAILDAAVALAGERGISASTMDDIAARAGVAKGSLYYNFASKDELFAALFDRWRSRLLPALRDAVAGQSSETSPPPGDVGVTAPPRPAEGLRALVRELLRRMKLNPQMAKLLVGEVFRVDRDWSQSVAALREALAETFREALLVARPDLVAPASGASLVSPMSALGAVLMAGLEWLAFDAARSLDEVTDEVCALLAPGAQSIENS